MDNIVLIGFMGCGKSFVGRHFSVNHRMRQIDTDQYIEEREGRMISDIFAEEGEEAFRQMETDVLRELLALGEQGILLSVGGGLPMREENRVLLKQFGTILYLEASTETLEKRLANDKTRPLLQNGDLHDKITGLMKARKSTYEELADYIIHTDHKEFQDIEMEIMLAMEGNRQ